ncbi:MAG: hypothetical protein A2Y67_01755 [Candidatus Buchananbacteria bacterium RBG_13_39_9]|uniref:Uncharacterized protein n=1 Tax=Candidatus Buchananbacteria bacterium RBG_13_39_9 TaxID=1797531 RepID=A0A1G1XQE0_9BACT|nr:MAG: hypothetical protein A2Y67_01755 [Candidatus Buchananbacteria bacterium RBG_13_39_9]
MGFLKELEPITKMRDLGDDIEIITLNSSHKVPKSKLRFLIAEELQLPFFQNSGANTICLSTWRQIQDLMTENGISLPETVSPCHKCNGTQCRFWCPKH